MSISSLKPANKRFNGKKKNLFRAFIKKLVESISFCKLY